VDILNILGQKMSSNLMCLTELAVSKYNSFFFAFSFLFFFSMLTLCPFERTDEKLVWRHWEEISTSLQQEAKNPKSNARLWISPNLMSSNK
jgi:hypothetical protein